MEKIGRWTDEVVDGRRSDQLVTALLEAQRVAGEMRRQNALAIETVLASADAEVESLIAAGRFEASLLEGLQRPGGTHAPRLRLVAAADDLSGENPPRDDEVRQVVQDWLAATQRELDAALDAAQLDAANRVRRASADAAAIVAAARSRHRGPAAWR